MRREIRVEAFLSRLVLFEGMDAAALARLAAATTRRELRRGETLFRQGEPSTGLHAVVYGALELRMQTEGAGEHLFDVVAAGQSFGEPVMFLDKPYLVSARAAADSLVLCVAKQAIFAELERDPAFARRVIAVLSRRVESLVREVESYALGSAKRRFVAWLLERRPADGAAVTLPGPKKAVASRLNLSAEHLSRILRELSGRSLITVRGRRVAIPDAALLRAYVGRQGGAAR